MKRIKQTTDKRIEKEKKEKEERRKNLIEQHRQLRLMKDKAKTYLIEKYESLKLHQYQISTYPHIISLKRGYACEF